MNKKGFVILVGSNEAKSLLESKLKESYWVWDVSTLRHLRHTLSALGWKFDNTDTSNSFINIVMKLANEFLDYEYNHITSFMEKTMKSTKAEENGKEADVLIVSQINGTLAERLQNEFPFFMLHVNMDKVVENNFSNGKFVLGLGDTPENVNKALGEIFELIIQ